MKDSILHTDRLSCGYKSKKGASAILNDLSLKLEKGKLTSLLGANGTGKSTLIRTLAGVQPAISGSVLMDDQLLGDLSGREIAKKLSLVLTERVHVGNLTVFALISLGRFPYTSWLGKLNSKDHEIIEHALASVKMLEFANTHIDELSDGERQKVMIARALAQDTDIIFLDEPTAHLDLPNRVELMHLLRELTHKFEKSILMSTHDLDSALKLSDELWVIDRDHQLSEGAPEDLILSGKVEKAFEQDELNFDYQFGSFEKLPAAYTKEVSIEGDQLIAIWLKNALKRNGIKTIENGSETILIKGDRANYHFELKGRDGEYSTIKRLLLKLNNL